MAFILQSVGNYYPTRNEKIVCGVMHITAGATDYTAPDTSAEGTLAWFKQKGSNVSIHGIVDSDTVQDCLPDEYTAWHAKGYNSCSIGLEIGTGQVDWRKAPQAWVDATIRNAAKWWAPRIVKWKIPLVKVGKAAVDAERRKGAAAKPVGFIGHGDLDPANRTDPGLVRGVDTFPWALFFTYAQQEVNALTGKTGGKTGATTGTGTKTAGVYSPGDTGDRVRVLQTELNNHWLRPKGWALLTEDGSYGPSTEAIVRAFQKAEKLEVDGYVGPATQAAMTKKLGVRL